MSCVCTSNSLRSRTSRTQQRATTHPRWRFDLIFPIIVGTFFSSSSRNECTLNPSPFVPPLPHSVTRTPTFVFLLRQQISLVVLLLLLLAGVESPRIHHHYFLFFAAAAPLIPPDGSGDTPSPPSPPCNSFSSSSSACNTTGQQYSDLSCKWCTVIGTCVNSATDCYTSCAAATASSTICANSVNCQWCSAVGNCVARSTTCLSSCQAATSAADCATTTTLCQWCSNIGICTAASSGACYTTCAAASNEGSAYCEATTACTWCSSIGLCRATANTAICYATCAAASADSSACDFSNSCQWCSSIGVCVASSDSCYTTCNVATPAGRSFCGSTTQCKWCSSIGICSTLAGTCYSYCGAASVALAPYCRNTTSCTWCSTIGLCATTGQVCYASCSAAGANSSACGVSTSCKWCAALQACISISATCYSTCNAATVAGSSYCASAALCQWCSVTGICNDASKACYTSCGAATRDVGGSTYCASTTLCRWCPGISLCSSTSTCPYATCLAATVDSTSCANSLSCQWCDVIGLCRTTSQVCYSSCAASTTEGSSVCASTRNCRWCPYSSSSGYYLSVCQPTSQNCYATCYVANVDIVACSSSPLCMYCPASGSCMYRSQPCYNSCAEFGASSYWTTSSCNPTYSTRCQYCSTLGVCQLNNVSCYGSCNAATPEYASCTLSAYCFWCSAIGICEATGTTCQTSCTSATSKGTAYCSTATTCQWCSAIGLCDVKANVCYPTCISVTVNSASCALSVNCAWCSALGVCRKTSETCYPTCPVATSEGPLFCANATLCKWCPTSTSIGFCQAATGTCWSSCLAASNDNAANTVCTVSSPTCHWCSVLQYCANSTTVCEASCGNVDTDTCTVRSILVSSCQWCPSLASCAPQQATGVGCPNSCAEVVRQQSVCESFSGCHWCTQHGGRCKPVFGKSQGYIGWRNEIECDTGSVTFSNSEGTTGTLTLVLSATRSVAPSWSRATWSASRTLVPSASWSASWSRSYEISLTVSLTLTTSKTMSVTRTMSPSPAFPSASLTNDSSVTTTVCSSQSRSASETLSTSTSQSITATTSTSGTPTFSDEQSKTSSHTESVTDSSTDSSTASHSLSSSETDTGSPTDSLTISIDPCNTTFRSDPTQFIRRVTLLNAVKYGTINSSDSTFLVINRVELATLRTLRLQIGFNTYLRNFYYNTSMSWFPLPHVSKCIASGYQIVNATDFVMQIDYNPDVSLEVGVNANYFCNVTFSTDIFQCQLMTNFSFNFSAAILVTGTPQVISTAAAEAVSLTSTIVALLSSGVALLQQARAQNLASLAMCQFSLVDSLGIDQSPLQFGFGSARQFYNRGCVVGNVVLLLAGLALGACILLMVALFKRGEVATVKKVANRQDEVEREALRRRTIVDDELHVANRRTSQHRSSRVFPYVGADKEGSNPSETSLLLLQADDVIDDMFSSAMLSAAAAAGDERTNGAFMLSEKELNASSEMNTTLLFQPVSHSAAVVTLRDELEVVEKENVPPSLVDMMAVHNYMPTEHHTDDNDGAGSSIDHLSQLFDFSGSSFYDQQKQQQQHKKEKHHHHKGQQQQQQQQQQQLSQPKLLAHNHLIIPLSDRGGDLRDTSTKPADDIASSSSSLTSSSVATIVHQNPQHSSYRNDRDDGGVAAGEGDAHCPTVSTEKRKKKKSEFLVIDSRRETHFEAFLRHSATTSFPSILALPACLLFDSVITSSVTLLFHPIDSNDTLIGVVGLLVYGGMFVGCVVYSVRVTRKSVPVKVKLTHPFIGSSRMKFLRYLFLPTEQYEPRRRRDRRHQNMMSFVLEEFRIPQFFCCDLALCALIATLAGVSISRRELCTDLAAVAVAGHVVFFSSVIWLRPFTVRFSFFLAVIAAALGFLSSLLTLLSMSTGSLILGTIDQYAAIGMLWISALGSITVIISVVAFVRSYRANASRRKARREELLAKGRRKNTSSASGNDGVLLGYIELRETGGHQDPEEPNFFDRARWVALVRLDDDGNIVEEPSSSSSEDESQEESEYTVVDASGNTAGDREIQRRLEEAARRARVARLAAERAQDELLFQSETECRAGIEQDEIASTADLQSTEWMERGKALDDEANHSVWAAMLERQRIADGGHRQRHPHQHDRHHLRRQRYLLTQQPKNEIASPAAPDGTVISSASPSLTAAEGNDEASGKRNYFDDDEGNEEDEDDDLVVGPSQIATWVVASTIPRAASENNMDEGSGEQEALLPLLEDELEL